MDREGIGQAELARELTKAGVHCTRSAVNRWLAEPGKDQRDPSPETLAAICKLLRVSADELLGLKEVPAEAAPSRAEIASIAAYLEAAREALESYVTPEIRADLERKRDRLKSLLARKGKIDASKWYTG